MIQVSPVRTIKDVEKLEERPWEEVRPASSTYELFKNVAEARPDATAITFLLGGTVEEDPICLTYKQLFGRINQAANMFNDMGAGPNDAISFLLPLLPQAQYTLWGGEAAGIANPINFLLQVDQIADLLNAAETKVLVAMGPNPALDIWEKVEAVIDKVPSLKAVLQLFGPGDESRNIYSFDQLIEKYPADKLTSGRQIKPSDIAAYFHTGGTTGSPKLAQHSHENEVYAAWAVANMWNYQPSMIGVNGLPLFHVAGAMVTSLAALAVGSNSFIPTPAGLRNQAVVENHWKLVEKYNINVVGGVPTSLGALCNVPVGDADISKVEIALTGGAALPVQVEKDFYDTFGVRVHQMYGATEATVIISMNPALSEPKIGSVGIRVPYEEWKIVKNEQTMEAGAPGETGVIAVKGPNVFQGYKEAAQNRGVLTDDGWLLTGDLGYIDEEGHLFLTGRAKDVIIRSAHNIDPAIIEEAMMEHPAVEIAAAVGKPDDYAGELPVVYVQLKPGQTADTEELMDFVSNRISERPALPKEVHIIEQMPMTAVGKIFKPQLRWAQAKAVLEQVLSPLEAKGIQSSVTVGEDKKRNALAVIELSGGGDVDRNKIESDIASLVGKFTYLKHTVSWK